jgi:hypothetical protein
MIRRVKQYINAKSIENVLNADADSIMKEQAFSSNHFIILHL